jgi:uncharacterized membrane protein YgcG
MSGKQNQPNVARIALVTIVGGGLMFVAAQLLAKPKETKVVGAVVRPTARTSAGTAASNDTAPVVIVRDGVPVPTRPALAGEPPIRNLFSPLVKPPAEKSTLFNSDKAKGNPVPIIRAAPPTIVKTIPPKPPVVDAASTVEMMGIVELDDKVQVLLKNRTTGERLYVSKGEEAFGYKVGQIKENSVELIKAGGGPAGTTAKPEMVAMSTLTIVEGAAAPVGPATPGIGGPGTPGGPGGPGGPGRSTGREGGRGGRGGRDGGRDGGGESGGGFTTAQLFSLPTWTERLKKLEEVKAQMPADRYERLKKFMADRAASEKK